MKKLVMFVIFMVVLSSVVFAAALKSSPIVTATLLSQSPDPVEPGQLVTVKFKIENSGHETTQDVIIKILPKFPFSVYGDVDEINVGKMKASSTGADAAVVEFKLKVDDEAIEAETEIELEIRMGDGAVIYKNDELLIDIQTHDAVLDITSITTEPKQVAPGEEAKISIMVKNLADSLLKDIKFDLDFESSTLPLAPFQSSSERKIALLKSGYQNTLVFKVIAEPDAEPGLYKVPVNITYFDEKGNSYMAEDILAVSIGDTPKLRPFIKKSTVLQSKSGGKITLGIANAGTTDVKFVELFLLESDDYQLVATSDYLYIGDIDSDDTESEEIDIYVNKVDKLNFPVKLKYYDANNKPYQQTFDLKMDLYSSYQLKKFGVVESGNGLTYFLILLLIIGVIVYYRKYYKQGKKLKFSFKRPFFRTVDRNGNDIVVKRK